MYTKSCFWVLYIFWKVRLSSFQKYIVCYGCNVVIYFMATTISTDFPLFPGTLAPFSQILNQLYYISQGITSGFPDYGFPAFHSKIPFTFEGKNIIRIPLQTVETPFSKKNCSKNWSSRIFNSLTAIWYKSTFLCKTLFRVTKISWKTRRDP